MDELPGNSKKSKAPVKKQAPKALPAEKKIEKVVKNEAKIARPSFGTRFKETFFGADFRSARSYIVTDVLIPAMRNLIVDATSRGVERLIYGETIRRRSPMGDSPVRPRVQYHSPTTRFAPRSGPMMPDQPPLPHRRGRDANDVILVSKEEADLVLERMGDILDTYEVVTVADLHDLCGLPTTYVDNKFGWFNLNYASVKQIREGYLIDLPPAEPVNN